MIHVVLPYLSIWKCCCWICGGTSASRLAHTARQRVCSAWPPGDPAWECTAGGKVTLVRAPANLIYDPFQANTHLYTPLSICPLICIRRSLYLVKLLLCLLKVLLVWEGWVLWVRFHQLFNSCNDNVKDVSETQWPAIGSCCVSFLIHHYRDNNVPNSPSWSFFVLAMLSSRRRSLSLMASLLRPLHMNVLLSSSWGETHYQVSDHEGLRLRSTILLSSAKTPKSFVLWISLPYETITNLLLSPSYAIYICICNINKSLWDCHHISKREILAQLHSSRLWNVPLRKQ